MSFLRSDKIFYRRLAEIIFLVCITMIVYFNSLKGQFQYDDRNQVQEHRYVSNLHYFWKDIHLLPVMWEKGDKRDILFDMRILGNRPTLLFTFALNNHLNSNNTMGFHLMNLLIHLNVIILIHFILSKMNFLQTSIHHKPTSLNEGEKRNNLMHRVSFPIVCATMFAVHPLGTDSVSYISSRSTLLSTFFYLLTVYCFLKLIQNKSNRYRFIQKFFLSLGLLTGYYLAITSKLIAITLPIMLLIIYFWIFSADIHSKARKVFWNKKLLFYLALVCLIPLKLLMDYVAMDKGLEMYGRINYFLIQFKVIFFYYLKMLIWPINQNVDIGFPFSSLKNDFLIVLSVIIILTFLTLSFLKGGKLLKLSICWGILSLSPTSSIMPLNDLAVEHRLYLPMALGLCPMLILAFFSINNRFQKNNSLIFILIAFSLLTISRNLDWASELNLWKDASKKNILSPRIWNNYAKALYERKEYESAKFYFEKTLLLISNPFVSHEVQASDIYYNIGNLKMDLGLFSDAESLYKKALSINPRHERALLGLASSYNQVTRYEEAIWFYRKAIDIRQLAIIDGDYPMARLNLGETLGKMGRYKEAVEELKIAIQIDPYMFKAYYNLGTAYLKLKRLDDSKQAFQKCLRLNPNFKQALFNLGIVFQLKNYWKNSNEQIRKFLEIEPINTRALFVLGINDMQLGNMESAKNHFEKIIDLKPEDLGAHINLGRIFISQNKFDNAATHYRKALTINPKLHSIHVQLGLIEWKNRKDNVKAADHFKKALILIKKPKEKTKIAKLLAQLSAN